MLCAMFGIGFVVFGVLFLLDMFLPKVTRSVQITDHTVTSLSRGRGARYKLHFNNELNGSCTVGLEAFEKLKDGDEVVVHDTRLFKSCVRVELNSVPVYTDWTLKNFLLGIGCIVYGIWWLKFNKD